MPQVLGDAGGLVARRSTRLAEHALGLVAGVDGIGAEERGDGGELALGLGVAAGDGVVEVGPEVDAFAPAVPVEQGDRAAGDDQEVVGWRRRR